MIKTEEIKPIYNTSGTHPLLIKSAVENFQDWLIENPDITLVAVQKTESGVFVVYEKNKVEKAVPNFGNKRK